MPVPAVGYRTRYDRKVYTMAKIDTLVVIKNSIIMKSISQWNIIYHNISSEVIEREKATTLRDFI